jgi:acyl-coenzyme A synthetase/AMP-(fatty) acid ligase
VGYLDPKLYKPESIGQPLAQTECRLVDENGEEAPTGQPGELVMRGPQFMLGYWNDLQATAAVLRDGWYWSGDVVRRDEQDFYYVVDRVKEMIKYKGFAVAPAQVEALLLEHPAVRDCGVVGCPDVSAGEIPVAFVALHESFAASKKMEEELRAYVADRLTHYKQPRQIRFVDAIPKTASGKILRRELRKSLA